MEGKVAVAPKEPSPAGTESRTLSPGQRLTLLNNAAPSMDTPQLTRITDWQRGQVRLDDTPLAEAVEEMNRYSTVQLVLDEATLARQLKVTGIFRAGDSQDFANALAHNFGLTQVRERSRILLTG